MIYTFPTTTDDLLAQLKASIAKMPQADRNSFVMDLTKFCIDWQFAYMAIREAEKAANSNSKNINERP